MGNHFSKNIELKKAFVKFRHTKIKIKKPFGWINWITLTSLWTEPSNELAISFFSHFPVHFPQEKVIKNTWCMAFPHKFSVIDFQKHFMWTSLLPESKYSSLDINISSNEDKDVNTLAPIQAESIRCLFSCIRTCLVTFCVTRPLSSFIILPWKPGISEFPPEIVIGEKEINVIDWEGCVSPRTFSHTKMWRVYLTASNTALDADSLVRWNYWILQGIRCERVGVALNSTASTRILYIWVACSLVRYLFVTRTTEI